MVPDGQYPFYISARSNEPVSVYYNADTLEPFTKATDVKQESFIYATEKPSYRINVTRGPVFFLDGSTAVYPNQPQLFNVSSGPVFVPPYEINFAVSRAATVDVQIVALKPTLFCPAINLKMWISAMIRSEKLRDTINPTAAIRSKWMAQQIH